MIIIITRKIAFSAENADIPTSKKSFQGGVNHHHPTSRRLKDKQVVTMENYLTYHLDNIYLLFFRDYLHEHMNTNMSNKAGVHFCVV